MNNYRYVSTREQLKSAIDDKVDYIVITDSDLAKKVKTVKTASKTALYAALGACGVGVANIWNPLGWIVTGGTFLIGAATGSTLIAAVSFLIVVLGVGILIALFNNYTLKFSGKVKFPNGVEISGEMILERDE